MKFRKISLVNFYKSIDKICSNELKYYSVDFGLDSS